MNDDTIENVIATAFTIALTIVLLILLICTAAVANKKSEDSDSKIGNTTSISSEYSADYTVNVKEVYRADE